MRFLLTATNEERIMARRAQRRDANERGIIDALTAIGCSVDQLDGGNGRPDLLIGEPRNHENILIEIKIPGEHLNPLQRMYHNNHKGRIHVVDNIHDALSVVYWYWERRANLSEKKVRQEAGAPGV